MRFTLAVLVVTSMCSVALADTTGFPLTVAPHDPVTAVAPTRAGAYVEFDVVAYGGRDEHPTVTCDPPSGSLFPLGKNDVRCVATNSFGERAEGGVYIFVYDVGGPTLHLPNDITVRADGPDGTVVTYEATAEDVIDGSVPVTCSPASGSRLPIGKTFVACSATDGAANTANGMFTVEVVGEEHLMIHVPDAITAEAEGPRGASVTFTVTADGTSDPNPAITCDPAAGATFPLGMTTVNCVARDSFGTTASGSFDVTVADTTPPSLFLPDPIVADAEGPDGATVTYTATAQDTVSGERPVTCNPPSGSRFPVGFTVVNCSAGDAVGNTREGSFTIEVRAPKSTVAIHVPDPITAEAEGPDGTAVSFTVTGDGTIRCDHASGSTFPLGTTTVQCTATDEHGNTGSDSFTVTIVDTMDPVISSISVSPDVLSPPNNKLIPVTITVEASDVADASPRCFVFNVTSEETINGDFRIVSNLEIELRAERDKDQRLYTVHVRCVDDSANAADGSVTVTVPKGAEQSTSPSTTPSKKRSVRGG